MFVLAGRVCDQWTVSTLGAQMRARKGCSMLTLHKRQRWASSVFDQFEDMHIFSQPSKEGGRRQSRKLVKITIFPLGQRLKVPSTFLSSTQSFFFKIGNSNFELVSTAYLVASFSAFWWILFWFVISCCFVRVVSIGEDNPNDNDNAINGWGSGSFYSYSSRERKLLSSQQHSTFGCRWKPTLELELLNWISSFNYTISDNFLVPSRWSILISQEETHFFWFCLLFPRVSIILW